jgi:hypothetical protein
MFVGTAEAYLSGTPFMFFVQGKALGPDVINPRINIENFLRL